MLCNVSSWNTDLPTKTLITTKDNLCSSKWSCCAKYKWLEFWSSCSPHKRTSHGTWCFSTVAQIDSGWFTNRYYFSVGFFLVAKKKNLWFVICDFQPHTGLWQHWKPVWVFCDSYQLSLLGCLDSTVVVEANREPSTSSLCSACILALLTLQFRFHQWFNASENNISHIGVSFVLYLDYDKTFSDLLFWSWRQFGYKSTTLTK